MTRTAAAPTLVDLNRLWVDSRVRALAQRRFEARVLLRLGGPVPGPHAVDLGTGRRGTGLRIAVEQFGAGAAHGIDVFPASVAAARAATADLGPRMSVEVADAAVALPFPDGSVDAVFAFHVLHHAPDWRAVVGEGARVLRPGGRWYGAEMTAAFVDAPWLRLVSHHPEADRPTTEGIVSALADAGIDVGDRVDERFRGWWVACCGTRT